MNKTSFIIFATGMLVTGCAANAAYAGPSDKAAAMLAGYDRTGEATACLNVRSINSIKALDAKHLLVRVGLNSYYLNEPSTACHGATRSNHRIQYTLGNARLCRNQIVTIVDNTSGITAGSCGLGSFEKLVKKPIQAE